MKKGDLWIAGILLVVLIGFMVVFFTGDKSSENGAFAKITVDGKHYETVPLTEKEREIIIETKFGYNLLKVSNYGIEMIDADCPDQLCRGFGHTHEVGDMIVCLPNRVLVEVIGVSKADEEGFDAIVN